MSAAAATTMTPSGAGAGATSAQRDMSVGLETREKTLQEGEAEEEEELRYADVGINLTDSTYRGFYNHHTQPIHPPDIDQVLHRASSVGVRKFLVTGSDLKQSSDAINLAKQYPGQCYATVGVHPCSAMAFEKAAGDGGGGGGEAMLEELRTMAQKGKEEGWVKAFGEIGLDYDRLHFCKKEVQEKWFKRQLDVAVDLQLPLFLHSRAAHPTFLSLLSPYLSHLSPYHHHHHHNNNNNNNNNLVGLIHSFTGTLLELHALLAAHSGLHIGINGCSLKTASNLAVVAEIPLERLQLETDGPWCEMRASHAGVVGFLQGLGKEEEEAEAAGLGWEKVKKEKWRDGCMVKGRNEPCEIVAVARVVAGVKGVRVEEVVRAAWRNSVRMFGFGVASENEGREREGFEV